MTANRMGFLFVACKIDRNVEEIKKAIYDRLFCVVKYELLS